MVKDKKLYMKYLKVFFVTCFVYFLCIFLLVVFDLYNLRVERFVKALFPLPLFLTGLYGLVSGYAASNEMFYIWRGKTSNLVNVFCIVISVIMSIFLLR